MFTRDTEEPRSLAVGVAQRLSRVLTWGMTEVARSRILLEMDADWELMRSERPARCVLARALRGIPAAILGRMHDHATTGLPTAFALTVMSMAALYAGLIDHAYPPHLRVFITFLAIGAGGAGVVLLRSPLHLRMNWLRLPTGAAAIGLLGIAMNMPTEREWPYDTPFVDTVLGDVLMVTGFVIAGVACLLILAATFLRAPRSMLAVAAMGGLAGLVSFATGLIVWGFVATRVDLALTASAIVVGLGGLSLAHVLPRLRHLEIV